MPKPPGEKDPIAAEIQAEIADHLATTAERLQSQGLAADEAIQRSQAKFGDATAITRRCYWIKQGDTLMFRSATTILLAILCLALGYTAFSSWQSQQHMAEQLLALTDQLKKLAEKQAAAPPPSPQPAEPQPLEITGNVFYGSREKPAANTDVMICRVSDGEIIRRVTTAVNGTFQSGPLTAGDYALLATGVKHSTWKSSIGTQLAPILLYPGKSATSVAIDVSYRFGRIRLKLSRPLPNLTMRGKYVIDSRLYLTALPSSSTLRSTRWTAALPTPGTWPILIRSPDSPPPPLNPPQDYRFAYAPKTYAVLANDDFQNAADVEFTSGLNPLPAGQCSLLAVVVTDVVPDGPLDVEAIVSRSRSRSGRPPLNARRWMSDEWIRFETMGAIWHTQLLDARPNPPQAAGFGFRGGPTFSSSGAPEATVGGQMVSNVEIADGKLTTLEVDVPADLLPRIQQLVENVTDPNKFEQAVKKESPFINRAKITILGAEPLPAPETNPAPTESAP